MHYSSHSVLGELQPTVRRCPRDVQRKCRRHLHPESRPIRTPQPPAQPSLPGDWLRLRAEEKRAGGRITEGLRERDHAEGKVALLKHRAGATFFPHLSRFRSS